MNSYTLLNNDYSDSINKWVYGLCFLSVLSQLPGMSSDWVKGVWIVFFIYIVLLSGMKIPLSKVLMFPIGFNFYALIVRSFTNNDFSFAQVVNMAVFIFVIGMMVGRFFNEKMFLNIASSYVVATLITSVVVWYVAIRGRVLSAGGYLYGSKNSFASIMLIEFAIIVILREELFRSSIAKIVYYFIVIYNLYMLLYLKSRTTLVALIILTLTHILFSNIKYSRKLILVVLIIAAVFFVINNEKAYDLIINNIWLKGKEANDVDGITSNRTEHIDIFKEYFPEHPWIGRGDSWLESFPLYSLFSYGILGSIMLFSFALSPIIIGIIYLIRTKRRKVASVLIATSISLLINCLGEVAVPFGPGVKCFLMWFLAGICNYDLYRCNNGAEIKCSDIKG